MSTAVVAPPPSVLRSAAADPRPGVLRSAAADPRPSLGSAAADPPTLDIAELYALLARRVERIVRFEVAAPEPVIEDACQVAWTRLIPHAHRVERTAVLTWLITTARREAVKLERRDRRELSLETELEASGERGERRERHGDCVAHGSAAGPEESVELRARLGALAALPERQRRMLWLRGLGFSYAEIAAATGDTPRTVERQLLRATHAARAVLA